MWCGRVWFAVVGWKGGVWLVESLELTEGKILPC